MCYIICTTKQSVCSPLKRVSKKGNISFDLLEHGRFAFVLIYFYKEVFFISKDAPQLNGEIRDKELRVISDTGEQLGIMSAKEAQALADARGVDLVKIAPMAKPPVCKIMDYSKYRYEQTKREKENRKKQKTVETKEIRLSLNIDIGDFNTKVNQARKFLAKGDKMYAKLRDAMINNKIVECWEANLDEPDTSNSGKFDGTYYQGYITEFENTSSAEDYVECSITYAENGTGADGFVTVTTEQQEVANYVFTDTQKTGA